MIACDPDDTGDNSIGLLVDSLGSTRLPVDGIGTPIGTREWDAWGNQRSATGTGYGFGWTGEQYDAGSDLVYLRSRYYSPGTGAFLSRDTTQPNAGGTTGYNAYAYANGNPTTFTDPSGHSPLDWLRWLLDMAPRIVSVSCVLSLDARCFDNGGEWVECVWFGDCGGNIPAQVGLQLECGASGITAILSRGSAARAGAILLRFACPDRDSAGTGERRSFLSEDPIDDFPDDISGGCPQRSDLGIPNAFGTGPHGFYVRGRHGIPIDFATILLDHCRAFNWAVDLISDEFHSSPGEKIWGLLGIVCPWRLCGLAFATIDVVVGSNPGEFGLEMLKAMGWRDDEGVAIYFTQAGSLVWSQSHFFSDPVPGVHHPNPCNWAWENDQTISIEFGGCGWN
jgi:RHS repeat-associated protein